MKRLKTGLAAAAVALVIGSLAAGCGGSGPISGAVSSAASSLATRTALPTLPSRSETSGPETSAAPATSAAAPSQPSPTAAPAAPAQATTPAAGESGSSLLWLWILLGALVVIGLIVWIARSSSRRSDAAAGWRSAVADAYARGQALADALRLADTPGAPAADAAARRAGLQARADDLAQELYRMRENAPGEEDRMQVEDALAALRSLRSAMAEEQAAGGAGGPGSPEAAMVRSRLMSFEASLRALREPNEQMPRI
jgi:hypothetical protein